MKDLKKHIIFFFLFIASFVVSKNVSIRVINKTNKAVDSLRVNGVFVVHLDRDSTTQTIFYKSMQFDSGNPEFILSSFIENKNIKSRPYIGWCGTSLENRSAGEYLCHLRYFESKADTFIRLDVYFSKPKNK